MALSQPRLLTPAELGAELVRGILLCKRAPASFITLKNCFARITSTEINPLAVLHAGTGRTDSDALGRLPHAGGPAASEYTDSMDVDIDGAAGASQGGASQQQVTGHLGVSVTVGSMDTAGRCENLTSSHILRMVEPSSCLLLSSQRACLSLQRLTPNIQAGACTCLVWRPLRTASVLAFFPDTLLPLLPFTHYR